jgi:hypothetical protein
MRKTRLIQLPKIMRIHVDTGSATLPPANRGIHDPDPVEKLRNFTLISFMKKTRLICITLMRLRIQLSKMMRIRICNTATCTLGNPRSRSRSRSRRKKEKSHLNVLHEKDETDPHHTDADLDPASQNDADHTALRIHAALRIRVHKTATFASGNPHSTSRSRRTDNLTLMYFMRKTRRIRPILSRTCTSGIPRSRSRSHKTIENLTFMYFMRKMRRI